MNNPSITNSVTYTSFKSRVVFLFVNWVVVIVFFSVGHAIAGINPKNASSLGRSSAAIEAVSESAIISNGTVMLGIAKEGHLNVPGGTLSSGQSGTTTVGLRYVPTNGEATAPGCLCEGWGVADASTGEAAYSNIASSGVGINMIVDTFSSTTTEATSVVTAFGRLKVTHFYHPHPSTPYLYVADITIENISSTDANASKLRYNTIIIKSFYMP